MTHATRAGINWVQDYMWGAVKVLGGIWANELPGSGGHNIFQRKGELRDLICDCMPWVPVEYAKVSTHTGSLQDTLAHRVRFCRGVERGGQGRNAPL